MGFIMAEPKDQSPPKWKFRETEGRKLAARDALATQREAADKAHAQREAGRDKAIAREDHAVRTARYCAGHDWVKERQERTGEIERSR
jgi:hypothetical protein